MRFFTANPNEVGVIAVGQMATGIIAFGQLARGCIAVGQAAIGLVAVGQASVGVFQATGMVGVAGRRGFGIIIPLIPTISPPSIPPATTSFADLRGGRGAGWVKATLATDPLGLGLFQGGQRLPIRIDRRLVVAGKAVLGQEIEPDVYAFTRAEGARFVTERIVYVPKRSFRRKRFPLLAGLQVAGLIGLGSVFWLAVGNDLFAGNGAPASSPAPMIHHSARHAH
jgi:hypothetical protein